MGHGATSGASGEGAMTPRARRAVGSNGGGSGGEGGVVAVVAGMRGGVVSIVTLLIVMMMMMTVLLLANELVATNGEDGVVDGTVTGELEVGKVTEDEENGRWNSHCCFSFLFLNE